MRDAEAREILGLDSTAGPEEIQAAHRRRIEALREEVRRTHEAPDWPVFEARLADLMRARQYLLLRQDPLAATQELPRLGRVIVRPWAVQAVLLALLAGIGLALLMLESPEQNPSESPPGTRVPLVVVPEVTLRALPAEPVVDRVEEPERPQPPEQLEPSERLMRLAAVRDAIGAGWQGLEQLPERTDLLAVVLPEAGPGWRWQGQRDGIFALVGDDSRDYLLALPRLGETGLVWGCVSASGDHPECLQLAPGAVFTARVLAGELDVLRLAQALDAHADDLAGSGYDSRYWLHQAARQGYADGARLLADAFARDGNPAADFWYAWAFDAYAHREAAVDATAVASTLARRLAPQARMDAGNWIQRCRQVVEVMEAGRCVTPGEIGVMLEQEQRWEEARWWFERGSQERDALAAVGLVRSLALGRGGSHEPWSALRLLEEAWTRIDDLSRVEAGRAAGRIARIWAEGWEVESDRAEAAWWASHGGRLGDPEAALDLAVAFAVGVGVVKDEERAERVLQRFRAQEPLIDVRFHRRLGHRREIGLDQAPDPQGASEHYRRAWEICQELAEAGHVWARLELAEMTLAGIGVVRDPVLAARRFEALLEDDPVRAGARLAWILATTEHARLRDGPRALSLAREVVGREQSAEYFEVLAAALAATEQWQEAVRMQSHALELLRESGDPLAFGADIGPTEQRMAASLERYQSLDSVTQTAAALPEQGRLRRDPD